MIKKHYLVFMLWLSLGTLQAKSPVEYVNTRIGNISHLLVPTFPTTHLPNSMLRMIPEHTEFVTDRLGGFPLNVPSHRQGSVLLLKPYCGENFTLQQLRDYRYDQEHSTPYEYWVRLDDYDINVAFAPAEKAALYTFTFEKAAPAYIVLETQQEGEFEAKGNTLHGYEIHRGIKHYFYLEFDQLPEHTQTAKNGKKQAGIARFPAGTKEVSLRYGISYLSVEQARKNLEKEIADYNLKSLSLRAKKAWNKVLGKIQVHGGTDDQKVTFYTALYRSHERMVNISEDGKYFSAFDGRVHEDEGIPFWTDDWIWDTYHALHPLQILLNPDKQAEKLTSYIRMYEQSGWMPTFPTVSGDAHCMNGNHAAVMFADALNKGIKFDVEKAFEGMKHTVLTETMIPWRRAPKTELDDFYHQHGWFPGLHPDEKETVPLVDAFEKRESVAVTLAASYDDWCIAQLAKALGRHDDYNFFIRRAFNYRNLFNKQTGFFHPKDKNGKFIEPFDYIFSGGIGCRAYYDEGNAWTYIWDVHHNIADLIHLFGGNQPFIDKLDRLFTEGLQRNKWQYYAVHPDATGNVGQFVMGNEPSFHIPYLYNYAGQPWKTQKRIRMLMESWFRNDLMGICGDEDGGGMSAFYVFSAMGFYPVSAGIPAYNIGSPLFDKITIRLEGGKKFTIIAKNASWNNKYIVSARLNGKPHNKPWFTHTDIINGGTLELQMADRPNKAWGSAPEAVPPSEGIHINLK